MQNVRKMTNHTSEILWCEHHNIFKESLDIARDCGLLGKGQEKQSDSFDF